MFGFLRPGCLSRQDHKTYRRVYAAYCSFQRQRYGTAASLFTSYEAVSLYLLGIATGGCQPVSQTAPTCCRLRNDWNNNWKIDIEAAEFCSAFAMLLAAVKVEDDIRDTRWNLHPKSIAARSVARLMRKPFSTAKRHLNSVRSGMVEEIYDLVTSHHDLEQNNDLDSLESYAEPTAKAFAIVYDEFSQLLTRKTGKRADLASIGFHVGRGIIFSDCLFDLNSDRERGEFNPIRTTADKQSVHQLALSSLSAAGWQCLELSRQTLLSSVFQNAFRRVAAFDQSQPCRKRMAFNRAGVCDCGGCDCFCDAGGADCGGCPCGGEMCATDPNGFDDSCPNSIVQCCFSCGPCDCPSGTNGKKDPKKNDSRDYLELMTDEVIASAATIGKTATTVGPLNPTGVVMLDGKEHPAKSQGEFIKTNREVIIVDSSPFGFIVRKKLSTD